MKFISSQEENNEKCDKKVCETRNYVKKDKNLSALWRWPERGDIFIKAQVQHQSNVHRIKVNKESIVGTKFTKAETGLWCFGLGA